mmetsp:Transcript_14422/g.23477  ORF Transcript_14422/g.23477 Transcript_14422/m.23477 type:complete len:89 (-) Transcript_14422:846-1112(-)
MGCCHLVAVHYHCLFPFLQTLVEKKGCRGADGCLDGVLPPEEPHGLGIGVLTGSGPPVSKLVSVLEEPVFPPFAMPDSVASIIGSCTS